MGYTQEIFNGCIDGLAGTTFTTALPLQTAANVYGSCIAHKPFYVQQLNVRIGTTLNDITAPVVTMQKVTVGDVTSSIVSMTFPLGAVSGKVYYKDCSPVKIGVGDKLQFKLSTAGAAGGTPVGTGFLGFLASLAPEEMTNETNAIAL